MNIRRDRPRPADLSRAARIAKLIAEDFYGDGLDFASRGMAPDSQGPTEPMSSPSCDQGLVRQDSSSIPEAEKGKLTDGSASGTGQDSARLYSVRASKVIRSLGGNDRVVRLFLTFISAMNRAREATQLWCAGMELYRCRPEMFDPQYVAGLELEALRHVLKAAGVSRKHVPDVNAWHRIAKSLTAGSMSAVKRAIDDGRGNAQELLEDLKSGGSRFPILRGPKVGPMWIRMMANPGRATIDRIDAIPVAVDVQVRRATENLGVTATRGLPLRRAKPEIHRAWMDAVSETAIGGPPDIAGTCAALDPALWFFGKHGCSHCEQEDTKVRFGSACSHCVRFCALDPESRTGFVIRSYRLVHLLGVSRGINSGAWHVQFAQPECNASESRGCARTFASRSTGGTAVRLEGL